MNKFKHDLLIGTVKILNPVLLTLPFMAAWFHYYASRLASPFYYWGNWVVVALFFILYVMFGKVYDGFMISIIRISEMVYSQALAAAISECILYVIICLLSKGIVNPLPLVVSLILQGLLSICWCFFAHQWYFSMFPARRSAVIYDVRQGLERLVQEYGLEKKFDIRVAMDVDQCLTDLSVLDSMDTVFLSGIHSRDRNIIIKYCVEQDINVYVIPRIGDVLMSSARAIHMFHLPMLRLGRYHPSPVYLFLKRGFDILASGIATIILSPVFIATAIAIKVHDGGPVFYKQRRLTKDGALFNVLKFRSMRVDAEKDGVARLSSGDNDDRITPVGRFIRKVRIDELPQLLNILKGDMTICGPRPERPEIAEQYEKELPEFRLRLQAKAGLTGYAQVYGKYNTTPYDKLVMDLMYIAHPSFLQDLQIMIATVKILFMKESTEGVQEGQTMVTRAGNEEKSA